MQKLAPTTSPAVTIERVTVTPSIAEAWLDRNISNRRIDRQHVNKLARDMKDGNFAMTGDAIRFDTNTILIDGQHRLLACIRAEVPFETIVIYNLPPETRSRLDGGRVRTASDVIKLEGFQNATILAGAARVLISERAHKDQNYTLSDLSNTRVSSAEILSVVSAHPLLVDSVSGCASHKYPRGIPVAQLSFLHYVGSQMIKMPEAAERFVNVMHTGIPSYPGDPAHQLREKIIRDTGGKAFYMQYAEKWRLFKHAWNLFAAGLPSKVMRGSSEVHITHLKRGML